MVLLLTKTQRQELAHFLLNTLRQQMPVLYTNIFRDMPGKTAIFLQKYGKVIYISVWNNDL